MKKVAMLLMFMLLLCVVTPALAFQPSLQVTADENPTIGGFEIVFIVLGVTQLVKGLLELKGKAAMTVALGVGFVLFTLGEVLAAGLLPESAVVLVVVGVRAVGYTISVPGLYDLLKDELIPLAAGKSKK